MQLVLWSASAILACSNHNVDNASFFFTFDDLFVTGSKQYVNEVLIPCLKAKYSVAVDSVENPGDEVSLLKCSHVLLEGGKMLIRSHHKHFSQLKELLGVSKKDFAKKTPSHPRIDDIDETPALADSDASKYRSAVGTLLYLAPTHNVNMPYVFLQHR